MQTLLPDALAELAPAACLALLLLAARGFARSWPLVVFLVLFLADTALLDIRNWLPDPPPPFGRWNWEGKTAALLLALAGLVLAPAKQLTHLGLFAIPPRAVWGRLFALAFVVCGLAVARAAVFGRAEPFSLETLAFQSVMPGLHEELTFRGLWWLCLASALDPGRLDTGRSRWGTLAVTTLLFASVHAIDLTQDGALAIEWPFFAATAVSGALYGLLQIVGRAVWIPIVVHNTANTLIYVWQMS